MVQRLHDLLRVAIFDRSIVVGDRLADEAVLIKQFDVPRDVLREALSMLAADGLIVRRRGLGTLVVGSSFTVDSGLPVPEGDLADQIRGPGELSTRLLHWKYEPVPAVVVAHLDDVREHDRCLCMEYVMVLGGRPVGLITNYLLARAATGMRADDFRGDFYQLLDAYGVDMASYDIQLGTQSAERRIAELLDIDEGDPIILFEQVIRDSGGAGFDFALGRLSREVRFTVTGIGRVSAVA